MNCFYFAIETIKTLKTGYNKSICVNLWFLYDTNNVKIENLELTSFKPYYIYQNKRNSSNIISLSTKKRLFFYIKNNWFIISQKVPMLFCTDSAVAKLTSSKA